MTSQQWAVEVVGYWKDDLTFSFTLSLQWSFLRTACGLVIKLKEKWTGANQEEGREAPSMLKEERGRSYVGGKHFKP